MSGMNLNPYNLNNNSNNKAPGLENKKMFSNHYGGDITPVEEIEEEEEKKNKNPYLKAYGYQTTKIEDVDLNKPIKKEKNKSNTNLNIILAGILLLAGLIFVLIGLLL